MKTVKQIIAELLVFTVLVQSSAFAGADILIEEIGNSSQYEQNKRAEPLTKEQLDELSKRVEALNPGDLAYETMGGRIINKTDGSEIKLECVEQSIDGNCMKVQFVHQTGFIREPLSTPIEYAKFVDFFRAFKSRLQQAVEENKARLAGFQVMPVTYEMYVNSDAGIAGFSGFLGGLTGGMLIGSATIPGVGWAAGIMILFWPVTTDILILPFRGSARGVKALAVTIKNKRLRKKYRRLQKAMIVMVEGANRSVKFKNADFEILLKLFKEPAPVAVK